jgi:hypothetical protein
MYFPANEKNIKIDFVSLVFIVALAQEWKIKIGQTDQ